MENKTKEGRKDDQGKPNWALLPYQQVEHIVRVLDAGAKKYAPDNWKHVSNAHDRYFAAAMRHLTAWEDGELLDQEDKLPHLAHAACCLLFLQWFDDEERKIEKETCAPKTLIRCECGGELEPTIDIIRDDFAGIVWECNTCKKTIMIVK